MIKETSGASLQGAGSSFGGTAGGGFEWTAGPGHGGLVGVTVLELDADQLITKVTSVYDSHQRAGQRS